MFKVLEHDVQLQLEAENYASMPTQTSRKDRFVEVSK